MTSSGPSSWTDIILDQLKEMDPNVKDVTDFSGMKATGLKLCGDILILTIDGFGMGQSHSNSTHDDTIPEAALLKHKFRGSWRGVCENRWCKLLKLRNFGVINREETVI